MVPGFYGLNLSTSVRFNAFYGWSSGKFSLMDSSDKTILLYFNIVLKSAWVDVTEK